jgi:hypothetical protein
VCVVVKNITTKEQMRRTGGKSLVKELSYGYFLNVHTWMIVVMCGWKEQEILNITHNGCKYK